MQGINHLQVEVKRKPELPERGLKIISNSIGIDELIALSLPNC